MIAAVIWYVIDQHSPSTPELLELPDQPDQIREALKAEFLSRSWDELELLEPEPLQPPKHIVVELEDRWGDLEVRIASPAEGADEHESTYDNQFLLVTLPEPYKQQLSQIVG